MWLLKLHFAISILCLMAGFGFAIVLNKIHKTIGKPTAKHKIYNFYLYFIPVLNILIPIAFAHKILNSKDDVEKLANIVGGKKDV